MAATRERVRIVDTTVLSDDWYVLRKVTFDFLRRDGTWQPEPRDLRSRQRRDDPAASCRDGRRAADAAVPDAGVLSGHDGMLLEAAAGLLDDETPEARIRAEAEEETGYRVRGVRKVFEAFMSPGSVTEKLHFFVGEYDASLRTGAGGGVAEEGEDLEVVEMPLQAALDAVERGEIVDAKTIMLLQYVALRETAGACAA